MCEHALWAPPSLPSWRGPMIAPSSGSIARLPTGFSSASSHRFSAVGNSVGSLGCLPAAAIALASASAASRRLGRRRQMLSERLQLNLSPRIHSPALFQRLALRAAEREVMDGTTKPQTTDKVEESLATKVAVWLQQMNMERFQDEVMEWCDEMGAEDIEEIVESADDLAEALGSASPEERSRLRTEAEAALVKAASLASSSKAKGNVFVFGFDGVVCNSIRESTMVAWGHAKKLWPKSNFGPNPTAFLAPMRRVAWAAEADWEFTLMLRLLSESIQRDKDTPSMARDSETSRPGFSGGFANFAGMSTGTGESEVDYTCGWIIKEWRAGVREDCMKKWDITAESIAGEVSNIRANWTKNNRAQWLLEQKPIDVVAECMGAMTSSGVSVFVITPREKDVCQELLTSYGLEVPSGNIYASDDQSKLEILRSLMAKPEVQGQTVYFVDGDFGHLKEIVSDKQLNEVNLYLADWGYTTEKELNIANSPLYKIDVLSIEELKLLGLSESKGRQAWAERKI